MKKILIFSTLLLFISSTSESRDLQLNPRLIRLHRSDATVILFPTFHLLTDDEYIEMQNLPQAVFDHIDSSDVIFIESHTDLYSADENKQQMEYFQQLILPNDGRNTVNDYISQWDETRRNRFLFSMLNFPGINHSFRQMILASRPWVFSTFFLPVIVTELAGEQFTFNQSVEDFIVEYARNENIPVLGLESQLNPFLLMDQAAQKEIIITMERFFSNVYTRNQVVEAYLHSIDILKQAWMKGKDATREEYFALGIMLGLVESEEDYKLSDYQIALREDRELQWIQVILDYVDQQESSKKLFVAIGNSHLSDFFINLFIENGFSLALLEKM